MKTLLLVLNINDAEWLATTWSTLSKSENIVVIAPSFDGRFVADSLDIPYKSYEEISWALDKLEIADISRNKARYWHEIDGIRDNIYVRSIKEFNGYPILVMEQSLLFLAIQEILQAHTLMHKIIELEQPDAIYFNERRNPFLNGGISFIADCNTVEREIVRSVQAGQHDIQNSYNEFINNLTLQCPVQRHSGDNIDFSWSSEMTGPNVLIFAIGGYHYFEYILSVIAPLQRNKARITLVVMEFWDQAQQMQEMFNKLGVRLIDRDSLIAVNEEMIWLAWKEKCDKAVEALYGSEALAEYFSDASGTYYPGLVSDYLCRQILGTATTVVNLLRAEMLISGLKPDIVLYHANIHSVETCDILPARKLGIPTLAIDHGINGYFDAQRMTFATEFYGVSGTCLKDAMIRSLHPPEQAIKVIGNTRCEQITLSNLSTGEAKLQFGFDPDRPLCIFCDQGGWSHMYEWRHATYKNVGEIIQLKQLIPELQIIYRIHHGRNYDGMSRYFEKLGMPDIKLQNSLAPILTDILPAADLVVSHYSSAVSEALASGVPVIYLATTGEPEPSYYGHQALKVVESFAELSSAVREVLAKKITREKVIESAQSFFDIALAGHDGKAGERLAQLILDLASTPSDSRTYGFCDWLERIGASCLFDTKEFRNLFPKGLSNSNHEVPFVSIIIPSYNREKMIGITIQSFIDQNYPQEKFEIVAADNCSTDNTRAVILEWQKKSPIPIRYVYVEQQGAHFARNSAAKQAKGDILYFTDDDMIAAPDLLSELVKVFKENPEIGTATGKVVPKWEVEPPGWIFELCNNSYLSLNDLGEENIISDHDIGVFSCHQAVTREAFFRAGGFNPDFFGTELLGDGETGLNIKLRDFGYKFGYNGKSVIHHMIPASRMTQDYLNKRLANQGSADCYTEYKKHRFSTEQLADRVQCYVGRLVETSSQCVDKRKNDDVRWRMEKAYSHYYLSRIEYDLRLMKDPDWRELVLKDDWINE